MERYIAVLEFVDDALVTISFDTIEEMEDYIDELSDYLKKIVLKLSYTVDPVRVEIL